MSAYMAAGITEGLAQTGQYLREAPERKLRMQEAQSRQQLSQMKLEDYKAQAPTRQAKSDLQMQQLQNDLYKSQAAGLKDRTFAAFTRFQGDRNVRHLNNFLTEAKQNPIGVKMYQDMVRVDPIDSPGGKELLKQAGILDSEGIKDKVNYLISTRADGSQVLLDMNQVYASTGFTRHMDDLALERASKEALNSQRIQSGISPQKLDQIERYAALLMENDPSLTKVQAHEMALDRYKPGRVAPSSSLERIADQLKEANPGMSDIEALEEAIAMKKQGGTYEERLASQRAKGTVTSEAETIHAQKERSADQVKIDEVNAAKDSLDEQFEGDFTTADMTKPENRRLASRLMSRIEQEFPMNVADRKVAKEIRQLTALGEVAGEEITDQQAGPIDSLIRGVKKYISNEVEGTEGTAAYETFRNTLRHALYGATLSTGEIGAFNAAMGSLAEQKGPVLVKLKTQMEDLKEQLSSVYDMNDPYVAKYRLNMDQDKLADVISAIDERIDMLDGSLKANAPGVIKPKLSIAERYKNR